jgi:predicted nucleic acid-binding protein
MRQGEAVFIDTGARIALAPVQDPLRGAAREQWDILQGAGARLHTSVPVVIETFNSLTGTQTGTLR